MSRVTCLCCGKAIKKINDQKPDDYAGECEDCVKEYDGDYNKRWEEIDNRVQLDKLKDKWER